VVLGVIHRAAGRLLASAVTPTPIKYQPTPKRQINTFYICRPISTIRQAFMFLKQQDTIVFDAKVSITFQSTAGEPAFRSRLDVRPSHFQVLLRRVVVCTI